VSSALYSLEGDFSFSPANASAPAPEVGHKVKLINFTGGWGQPPTLNLQRFAHNKSFEEAFPDGIRGFNRPTNVRLGPMAAPMSPITVPSEIWGGQTRTLVSKIPPMLRWCRFPAPA
jgi:hypothetical protein